MAEKYGLLTTSDWWDTSCHGQSQAATPALLSAIDYVVSAKVMVPRLFERTLVGIEGQPSKYAMLARVKSRNRMSRKLLAPSLAGPIGTSCRLCSSAQLRISGPTPSTARRTPWTKQLPQH